MIENLSERISNVRSQMGAAAERAGRVGERIELVAVSKTHPVGEIRKAILAGVNAFGENKVQEAEDKIAEIGRGAAEWHLIGHLQSNKVRKAVRLFDVIHTLDSAELAERLERICGEQGIANISVLLQVDLANEATKNGIKEEDLPELIEFLRNCAHLTLTGFMIIPPYFESPERVRPYFRRLRDLRDQMLPGGELSMGMSHDFETAIEEGATMVRVGTAIFGERNYHGV